MRKLATALAGLLLAAWPIATAAAELSTYVLMTPTGPVARAITDAPGCPRLIVDGKRRPMRVRAAAGTEAQRPTASDPSLVKPSAFPVTTCEASLPRGARRATLAGRPLALPKAVVRRIVVIGDTGCRLKASDKAYQACNDPKVYPFARTAAQAAAWKPDLVVHVGDYQYRENPCDPALADCGGSPWGYGWDAWKADFFGPGAPLLAAAPWAAARGNHEDCARAGQGWMRFLDAWALGPERSCNDPANDHLGDDDLPFALPLGGGAQVIVADMTTAGNGATPADDPRFALFTRDHAEIERLASKGGYSFLVLHKPILGFAAILRDGQPVLVPSTPGIQSVFAAADPGLLPKGVGTILTGHVHVWEQVGFANDYPSQFISGFSGTQEDTVPIPRVLPTGATPYAGAAVASFSSWVNGFGFMTLERRAADRWDVKVWDLDGHVTNRCTIRGRTSACEKPQV